MKTFKIKVPVVCLLLLSVITGCGNIKKPDSTEVAGSLSPEFKSRKIFDSAAHWWAQCPADINNDGISDLFFIHENSSGGYLAYLEGRLDMKMWEESVIAEVPPTGGLFASGDLECGDIDHDGDTDVLAVKHPGEWQDAGAPAEIFWYENPEWQPHFIGVVPDAVKDFNLGDFDGDERLDLAVMTFDESSLSIFIQEDKSTWKRALYKENYQNLHEGMGIGDFNGDGQMDLVANGYLFYNPGTNDGGEWSTENLDKKWNNQTGDWSRNATKIVAKDINGDGVGEIFIGHSERDGYPLSMYQKGEDGMWKEKIIKDTIPACHTLQVFDFDLDGDQDILAGINFGRAVNLDIDHFEVMLFLNEGDAATWSMEVIGTEGIYNGQAADYDGDGDFDIFRYPHHEATDYYIMENMIRN